MRDASYVVAILGALFLAVAAIAWWKIGRKPDEQPPTSHDVKRGNFAASAIVIAFALSVVAAVIAIFGWFQR